MFVTANCCVYSAVRTEFFYNIWTSFGFKGLVNSPDVYLFDVDRPGTDIRGIVTILHQSNIHRSIV
jgi:hypothetical protein